MGGVTYSGEGIEAGGGPRGARTTRPIQTWANTKSMIFDGENEHVTVPHSASVAWDGSTPFSISFWVKPLSGHAGSPRALGKMTANHATGYEIWITANNGNIGMYLMENYDLDKYISAWWTAVITPGVWQHVVWTSDGSKTAAGCRLYVNGVGGASAAIQSASFAGNCGNTEPLLLGSSAGQYGRPFLGSLDEIAFWNKVLTQDEAVLLYNSGAPADLSGHPAYANCLAWWRMGDSDDSITQIKDRKGTSHGSPVNMEAADIQSDVP